MLAALVSTPAGLDAGNLEPSAPPGPTMKTLDEIPPTWSQVLPASARYVLVMNGEGVLDKETGLVWERSPALPFSLRLNWNQALLNCSLGYLHGRAGWHLPTIEELTSVTGLNRALDAGHPFDVDCSDDHCVSIDLWSATSLFGDPSQAFVFSPNIGGHTADLKTSAHRLWCVRGGEAYDRGQ